MVKLRFWVSLVRILKENGFERRCQTLESMPLELNRYKRPTTLKTRYIVNGFQVLRVDQEVRSDIEIELSDRLLKHADAFVSKCDILAIADYDKGTITSYFIDQLVAYAKKSGKKIIAQPKIKHYLDFREVDYVKSNEREASIATRIISF